MTEAMADDRDRWLAAKALLQEALARPPEERARCLDAAVSDPELRAKMIPPG